MRPQKECARELEAVAFDLLPASEILNASNFQDLCDHKARCRDAVAVSLVTPTDRAVLPIKLHGVFAFSRWVAAARNSTSLFARVSDRQASPVYMYGDAYLVQLAPGSRPRPPDDQPQQLDVPVIVAITSRRNGAFDRLRIAPHSSRGGRKSNTENGARYQQQKG